MPVVKVTQLTQPQVNALSAVHEAGGGDGADEFVIRVTRSYVLLNGTTREALGELERIMVGLGESSPTYRPLVSVREKLLTASKSPDGTSYHVKLVDNGANVSGDVPSVLAGASVDPDAGADRGVQRRTVEPSRDAGEAPAPDDEASAPDDDEAPVPADEVPAETPSRSNGKGRAKNGTTYVQPGLTPDCIPNLRYMAQTAPTTGARAVWQGLIEEIQGAEALTTT